MQRMIWILIAAMICLLTCGAAKRHVGGDPVVITAGNLESGTSAFVLGYDGTASLELSSAGWQMGTGANVPTLGLASTTLTLYTYYGSTGSQYNLRLDTGSSHVDSYIELDANNVVYGSNASLDETYDAGAATDYRVRHSSLDSRWNYDNADLDTVIYGSTDAALLFVNAGLDAIGISTNAPGYLLDVDGTFSANSINVNDAYTLPAADGTATYALTTDGAGTVSWSAVAGAPDSDWTVSGTDLVPFTSGNDVVLSAGETLGITGAAAGNEVQFFSVTGDADSRFSITAGGALNWGDGTNPPDLVISRGAAGRLDLASGDSLNLVLGSVTATDSAATYTANWTNTSAGSTSGGAHGTSSGGTANCIGMYGTATGSATINAGVYGYTTATANATYGGLFWSNGSGSSNIGVCGLGGSGNADYGVLSADKSKAGTSDTFDEWATASSPYGTPPPAGDARVYYLDNDVWFGLNSSGKVYGWGDRDADTKIEVEESADEDKIRLDTGGTERVVIDSTGVDCSVEVSATGNFDVGGVDGVSGVVTVITDVDFGPQMVKYRVLTYTGGIITTIGAESGWTAAPLVP